MAVKKTQQESSQPLETILKKGIRTTIVYPIVVLLIVFTLIVYLLAAQAHRMATAHWVQQAGQHAVDINQRAAAMINKHLTELSSTARVLQAEHQQFVRLPRTQDLALPVGEPVLKVDPHGVLYKAEDNGGAGLFYPISGTPGPEHYWKARNSEHLDALYAAVIEANPVVTQLYFNTWDNMNRLYPYVTPPAELFAANLHVKDFNFYYLADAQHNPARNIVWTSAYLDPAGSGWMISVLAPVYNDDFLEGVLGFDVTLDTIVKILFDEKWVVSSKVFLLDPQQTLLAMTPDVARLIGLPEDEVSDYAGLIKSTVPKPEKYQLAHTNNPAFSEQVTALIHSQVALSQVTINGVDYLLSRATIDETGWQLVMLQDMPSVLAPLKNIEKAMFVVSWLLCIVMVIVTVFYLRYIVLRAHLFSNSIATPINQLATMTNYVGKKEVSFNDAIEQSNIDEINLLVDNFSRMADELDERSQTLIKANLARKVVEEKARLYQVMANTDQLTGLHNRKYLDTILRHEGIKANRYKSTLSLMLFDIDHFKNINDKFGHQVGDLVLKKVAKCLKDSLRQSDVLGRWGGEEFLLICINTPLSDTADLAEKLRAAVELLQFEQPLSVTVSIGVAQLQSGETTEKTIARADAMLYRSKHHGRNQVSVDREG